MYRIDRRIQGQRTLSLSKTNPLIPTCAGRGVGGALHVFLLHARSR